MNKRRALPCGLGGGGVSSSRVGTGAHSSIAMFEGKQVLGLFDRLAPTPA